MQVVTLILIFLYLLFGVYDMIFIYMVIVKEIVFTCIIYAANLYHQSELDVPNFCVT